MCRAALRRLFVAWIELVAGRCRRSDVVRARAGGAATAARKTLTAIALKPAGTVELRLLTSGDERRQPIDAAIVGQHRLRLRLLLRLRLKLRLRAILTVVVVFARLMLLALV